MTPTIAEKGSTQRVIRRGSRIPRRPIVEPRTILYRSLQASPKAARQVRASLSELLMRNAVDAAAKSAALLCFQEALTNAIRHTGELGSRIGVTAQVARGDLRMEVRDRGCGFDSASIDRTAVPDLLSEHGRGLFLMQRLMDDVEISSDSLGTTVRMTLHLS